ncbi:MAG TPA: hypothetical protein VFM31_01230 [Nitrososphaeraceae archaeon]|nr:hypothetical protein [Nitrososphaeraceae archaeon]
MDFDAEILKLVEIISLRNALDYNGQARLDSVISKLLALKPEIKSQIKVIIPKVR